MDMIFDTCVYLLLVLADAFGMTYKAINVWIFVIIWPVFTLALIAIAVIQRIRIRQLFRVVNMGARREQSGGD